MFCRCSTEENFMNRLVALMLVGIVAVSSAPVWAAMRTVTLSVPGMTCAACPITVKKALVRVDGVVKAEIDFGRRLAMVTFDDARVDVAALTAATTEAGYPSTVRQ
jgi:mercuric ion binding protein